MTTTYKGVTVTGTGGAPVSAQDFAKAGVNMGGGANGLGNAAAVEAANFAATGVHSPSDSRGLLGLTGGAVVGAGQAATDPNNALPLATAGLVSPGDVTDAGKAAAALPTVATDPNNVVPLATAGLVTPQDINNAGTAIGKLPGDAASAVGAAGTAIGGAISGALAPPGGGGNPADPSQLNDFRTQQQQYADALRATIAGTAGPSAADIQGHNAQDRAIAQQFAAAQGATGANTAMAYRQALQNAAGISQQGGADAATLRAKEVTDAENQLGTNLSAARTGDLTKYSTDTGAGNVRYAADKDFEGKAIAAGTGAASGIIGGLVSDENEKTGVASGDVAIAEMLDALQAKKFKYKDTSKPGTAPGKRAGVMAQDLEKSMAGNALVKNTPDGKVIDSPQAIGAVLAALASLHGRMKRVEGRGA